jgi:hypothetical protein
MSNWLLDRVKEPSTWAGIAAFFTSFGLAIVGANTHDPSVWIAAIGAGAGGVAAFVKKEQGGAQ